MLDDARLLAAVLNTDDPIDWRDAWAAFVGRFQRLIARNVIAILRSGNAMSPAEADDAIGDVWLALIENDMSRLRRYDASLGAPSTFVGLIAARLTIDRLRRHRLKMLELVDADEHASPTLSVEAAVEASDRLNLLRRAVRRLGEYERNFVLSLIYEERPPAEIAVELGISINTVYSRKAKLQKKLLRLIRY
jgi:RNA polymerase sigma-70 factor (ECF subfamily)